MSRKEFDRTPEISSREKTVKYYLPPFGVPQMVHINETVEKHPAREFLLKTGAPPSLVNDVFLKNGELKPHTEANADILKMSPESIINYLKPHLKPVYDLAQYSLSTIDPWFNLHTFENHIDIVTKRSFTLLNAARPFRKDINEKTFIRSAIVGTTHDVGNLLSREDHEILSLPIAEKIIPPLKQLPQEEKKIIDESMVLHRKRQILTKLDKLKAGESMNADQEVELMSTYMVNFPPESLALMIADTSDVSPLRVARAGKKLYQKEALKRKDLEVNLHWITRSLRVEKGKKWGIEKILWELEFNPQPTLGQKPKGELIYPVNTSTSMLHKEHELSNYDQLRADFWKLYLEDIKLAVQAGFALFPATKKFEIVMINKPSPTSQSKNTDITEFVRGELNAFFPHLDERYPHKKHQT